MAETSLDIHLRYKGILKAIAGIFIFHNKCELFERSNGLDTALNKNIPFYTCFTVRNMDIMVH